MFIYLIILSLFNIIFYLDFLTIPFPVGQQPLGVLYLSNFIFCLLNIKSYTFTLFFNFYLERRPILWYNTFWTRKYYINLFFKENRIMVNVIIQNSCYPDPQLDYETRTCPNCGENLYIVVGKILYWYCTECDHSEKILIENF